MNAFVACSIAIVATIVQTADALYVQAELSKLGSGALSGGLEGETSAHAEHVAESSAVIALDRLWG